jgi:hypothetical protein
VAIEMNWLFDRGAPFPHALNAPHERTTTRAERRRVTAAFYFADARLIGSGVLVPGRGVLAA